MDKNVKTEITTKDFQDMFKKKNELTACGPQGIIMPHWKILVENEELSSIHANLISTAF